MSHAQIIDGIIAREGGYVNDPNDPGGRTKYGVTEKNWLRFERATRRAHRDIAAITSAEAHAFYEWYFRDRGVADYPPEILEHVLDMATLHGGYKTILRRALNISVYKADTLEDGFDMLVQEIGGPAVNAILVAARSQYVTELADRRPALRKFHRGWMNRIIKFLPAWK